MYNKTITRFGFCDIQNNQGLSKGYQPKLTRPWLFWISQKPHPIIVYNYIKNKYGSKAKLLFTDTDSLTYEITAKDVYKDFWADKDKFDNSDYPQDSPYFDKTNKKVIGKF